MSQESIRALIRFVPALLFAAVVGFWVYVTSLPVLRDATTMVTVSGGAHSVERDEGDVWFGLYGSRARYAIAQPDHAALAMLRASEESGNAVTLRIHLDGARFGVFSNDPEYWVHSVEYLGKSHGNFASRIRWSWRAMGPGDAGLLRGFLLDEARHHEEAVKALDAGIDAQSLNRSRRALAHLTRASALESLAYAPGRAINDRDDRVLVRAITDYRQAAMLDDSEYRAIYWQGHATASLGAYDEALALYEELEHRWPDQYFRAAIARGATFRQIGKFDAALRELDALVKERGEQDGMMYHYHRGWTLNELHRYPEAVKEFTAGLRSQPDYLWAFVARACAYAQQGEIERALADQTRAVDSWNQMLELDSATSAQRRQGAALENMKRELAAALQAAPDTPSDAPCDDTFDTPATRRRERSKWFEPAFAPAVELP